MPALDFTTLQAKSTPAPAAAPPSASSRAARGEWTTKGAPGAATPHEPFGRLVDRLTDAEADVSTPDTRQDRLRGRTSHDTRAAREHQSEETRTRSAGEESNAASTSGETTGSMAPAATQPAFPWTLPLDPALWSLDATGSAAPAGEAVAVTSGTGVGSDVIGTNAPEAATDPAAGVTGSSPAMPVAASSLPGTEAVRPSTTALTSESTAGNPSAGAVPETGGATPSNDQTPRTIAGSIQGAWADNAPGAAGTEAGQRAASTFGTDPTLSKSTVDTIDDGVARMATPTSSAASRPSTAPSADANGRLANAGLAPGDALASHPSGDGTVTSPSETNTDGPLGDTDRMGSTDPNGRPIQGDAARRQATRELLRAFDGSATNGQAQARSDRAANAVVSPGHAGESPAGRADEHRAASDTDAGTGAAGIIGANQKDGVARPAGSDKSAANAGAANEHTFTGGNRGFGAAGGDTAGERGSGFGGRFGSDPRDPAGTAGSSSRGAADAIGSGSTSAADFRALSAALAAQGLGGTSGSAADAALPAAGYGDLPIDTGAPAAEQAAQIVRAMRLQWRGTVGEATLRLQPEHLGQVIVHVRVEQGVVSATVHAETPAAQQWIQGHQQQLRDALDAQGLRVAQFHVTSNPDDRPRDQPQQEPSDRRGHAKRRNDPDGDDTPRFEIRV